MSGIIDVIPGARRWVIVGLVLALLPSAVTAHDLRAVGGDGPGEEWYLLGVGFRDEPVYVQRPNALLVSVVDAGSPGGPVEGLEASLDVEVEHGGQTLPLQLVPRSEPGFYEAPFVPDVVGAYRFHLFGTINQVPVDQSFIPDTVTSSWLEPPAAAGTSQGSVEAFQPPPNARPIEAVNARAEHSQRLVYIGVAIGTLGLLIGLVVFFRSGRSQPQGTRSSSTKPRNAATGR